MPERTITADAVTWTVAPSGYMTKYTQDEYGLVFSKGSGPSREVRVTRYSPQGSRSREESFAELTEEQLREMFSQSQPSFTSPEAGYTR